MTLHKTGIKLLTVVAALAATGLLALYLFCFRTLEFERSYLHPTASPAMDKPVYSTSLRRLAEQNHIYLGAAISDISEIDKPAFQQTYNAITPTDQLKLSHLLKSADTLAYDFNATDNWVDTAYAAGLRIRGHTLLWGRLSDRYKSPDLEQWLKQFPNKETKQKKLRALVENHFNVVLKRYQGKIKTWDVVNEPITLYGQGKLEPNVFSRYLGEDYVAWALTLAHQIAPELKLYINQQLSSYTDTSAQALIALVKQLKNNGVPLHGVGLQHHMLFKAESIKATQRYIARLNQLGVEVELTEVDTRLRLFKHHKDPYMAQGQYYRDLVEACLTAIKCAGVTFWGFSDKNSWLDEHAFAFPKPNEPYLFDDKYRAKSSVKMLRDLFYRYQQNRTESVLE